MLKIIVPWSWIKTIHIMLHIWYLFQNLAKFHSKINYVGKNRKLEEVPKLGHKIYFKKQSSRLFGAVERQMFHCIFRAEHGII